MQTSNGMDHKQASDILIKIINKRQFNNEEKEALNIALGVLAWTKLAQSRIKSIKKRNKNKHAINHE